MNGSSSNISYPTLSCWKSAVIFLVALLSSFSTHVVWAMPIQDFCALQGPCDRIWSIDSSSSGSYRQDGVSNVPSGNYFVGADAPQGGVNPAISIYRNFFTFDMPSGISYNANTRLIAQLQIHPGSSVPAANKYHLFDPIDRLAGGDITPFIDNLVAGTGGVNAYERLGGDITFQSDFGSASTGSNDFISLGLVNLNIHAIARSLNASLGILGEHRFVVGGRLDDYNGDPINGSGGINYYFGGTGSNICPDCGAKLVIAEIDRSVTFVPEPPTVFLFGLGSLLMFVCARKKIITSKK